MEHQIVHKNGRYGVDVGGLFYSIRAIEPHMQLSPGQRFEHVKQAGDTLELTYSINRRGSVTIHKAIAISDEQMSLFDIMGDSDASDC